MGNSHVTHSRSQRSRSLSDTTLDTSRYITKTQSEESNVNKACYSKYKHIRVNGVQPPSTSLPQLEVEHSDSARSISDLSSSRDKVVIIEGWLTKRGETSKKLKKRYWKLYDNGTLKYNTKASGSFKKYAHLKGGIGAMSFLDENGFVVDVSERHLIFYAETTKERDDWFTIIYKHYFEKGKEKVKLLTKSLGDKDNDERKTSPRYLETTTQSHSTPRYYFNGHYFKEDERIIFNEEYMNQDCDGKTCLSLERVHYVFKKYDLWRHKQKQNKMKSLGMYKYINNGLGEYYNNTHLLNDYNHLIEFHDNVFNHIYQYLCGECDFNKCLLIKRLHRDRDYYKDDEKRMEIYYHYNDPKEINTQQILDKIHCFYRHSYDLGFRVKISALLSIKRIKAKSYTLEESEDKDEAEDDGFEDEWKLLEICGLIKQKRNNLRVLRGTKRMNTNKFISRVDKAQRYHYWKQFDDDDDKHWKIDMKYHDFKQEMLYNDIYTISSLQWQYLNEAANDHIKMKRTRKIRTTSYWAQLYQSFSITISHLISIMIYCNFDTIQRVFANTFYRLNDTESDEELKNRHSNFFHFGRLLRELIECFGKKIYNKNIVFYHGITDDMMFIETTQYFNAPLSTTTSIEVAIAYSHHNDKDYLLQLVDDDSVLGMARYFDCNWISDFGNESEKYFIGGYKPLKIYTVLDAVLGRNYINYLRALHIINRMMDGYYFENEPEEIKEIVLHLLQTQISNHVPQTFIMQKFKSFDDDDSAKIISHRRIISRRISETFHSLRNKTEEYDYFNQLPKYITKLVDHYCINVVNVCIDWSNMIGAIFCKKLLCNDKYEWIKLNIFLILFPNLKQLNVRNIKLSSDVIHDIYTFLFGAKRDNKYPDLYRIQIFELDEEHYPIAQCLEQYLEKFKDVGWTITFNPFEDEMCILKL